MIKDDNDNGLLEDGKHLSTCCGQGLVSKRPSRTAYVKVLAMHFIRAETQYVRRFMMPKSH